MFMQKVYKNILGYVKFSGNGVFPERFLNLCAKENILVWNPKVNVNEISGYMRINDYKRIRKIAKKSCMRIKITKRVGLPFLVNRYRHRYGIPIGAVLFFIIIWYLSGFVFNISINGNITADKKEVLSSLKNCGVYLGQRTSNIDAELTRQKFLINNPEFSWAALNIKGSYITVELAQTTEKNEKSDDKEPCNIIAKNDGKIIKIKAYEGKPAVSVGEAVTKGDLLVSGVIELTDKTTKFVHSNAEVTAQTRHSLKVFVPFDNFEELTDEKTIKRSVLSIANIDIPLFLGEISKPYKVKYKTKNYCFFGKELPIKKTTAYFKKISKKKITLDEQSAKQLAIEKMEKKAQKLLKNTIKTKETAVFTTKINGILMKQVFICEENIAKEKKILKNFSEN
ncbi:MAG: sporulation protein YqfD [Acutalibacteraceae bacterium]|nr:sporulation protein YqfD [Acutalibacteraceae bacterium]